MSDGIQKPRFQLEKIYDDGSREEPELHSLDGIDANCRMGRRGFLLTSAIGAGALAALLTGCSSEPTQSKGNEPAGPKTSPPPRINAPEIHSLAAHRDTVHSLVFSPDNKTLFTAGNDNIVKLWSIPEGKLQKTFGGAEWSRLVSIALGADGKTVVAAHSNGMLKFWREPFIKVDKETNSLQNITNVALGPDGKTLAVSTRNGIRLHSFPSGKVLATLVEEREVSQIVFSPDGTMLAGSVLSPKEVLLWSVPYGDLLARWSFSAERMVFNADGTLLVSDNHQVKQLRCTPSGKTEEVLGRFDRSYSYPFAFSPDGEWLAIKEGILSILLLPAPFSRSVLLLEHMSSAVGTIVFAVAFSRDNRFLAVGTTEGAVYVWELTGSEETPCTLRAVLYDADGMPENVSAQHAVTSEKNVYIGRCGDPLPLGAVCTCNCVAGRVPKPSVNKACTCNTVTTCTCNTVRGPSHSSGSSRGGGSYCRCNKICTCVPVK